MESEIESHEKQIQSLRQARHEQSGWLQKIELRSSSNEQNLSKLSEEVRNMDIAIGGLSNKLIEATDSLRSAITGVRETVSVEKVKIALIMAGIGFTTGIISSIVTAVLISRLIG